MKEAETSIPPERAFQQAEQRDNKSTSETNSTIAFQAWIY